MLLKINLICSGTSENVGRASANLIDWDTTNQKRKKEKEKNLYCWSLRNLCQIYNPAPWAANDKHWTQPEYSCL